MLLNELCDEATIIVSSASSINALEYVTTESLMAAQRIGVSHSSALVDPIIE